MATRAPKLTTVEDALGELQPQLAKLRDPFKPNQISKLPKPYKRDSPKGKCTECGGYHGLPAVHLDYVGHAALTDRLLDTDLEWSWEPVGFTPEGLPALDRNGGLWIKLTVCGVTRYGYGAADGKSGGDAMKEMIGDALRNAAMRFGAALDLWHKGDLHVDDEDKPENPTTGEHKSRRDAPKLDGPYDTAPKLEKAAREFARTLRSMGSLQDFDEWRKDEEVIAFVEQCKRDLPGWWFPNHPDCPPDFTPLSVEVTTTKRGLEQLEEVGAK
jgi:hypothetical protein